MDPWDEFVVEQEQQRFKRNQRRNLVLQAVATHVLEIQEEENGSNSSRRHRQVIKRDRQAMDERLKSLYFTSPCRFQGDLFRRRYRMRPDLFDRIMHEITNHDSYFVQRVNASGVLGYSTEMKLTCAVRMLAYSIPADLCDEFLDIAETTTLQILKHFTRAIWAIYHKEYLRRPSPVDLQRLLNVADTRGFPGMVGSLDCMHWQWKNCPTSWQRHFTGYKRKPTIILEAVASYDTWIWHAFFGLPGSLNDINVLGQSPLFNEVCQGESPHCVYYVNGCQYGQTYYLVDGIYPKYENFVKNIRNPVTPPQAYFSAKQESYRKDVERAFGILQARFAIIKGPARGWDREDLQYIMMTCVILHNMIVENERDEYGDGIEIDPDEVRTRPKRAEVYDMPPNDDEIEVERNSNAIGEFMTRYNSVTCPIIHNQLKKDLVNHVWNVRHQ